MLSFWAKTKGEPGHQVEKNALFWANRNFWPGPQILPDGKFLSNWYSSKDFNLNKKKVCKFKVNLFANPKKHIHFPPSSLEVNWS